MSHSRRLFENLPLYAQLADDIRLGLLAHLCDRGLQVELDIFHRLIEEQEYFYNPDHPLAFPHLVWLGKFVGLNSVEGYWAGLGINPDWEIPKQQQAIKNAIAYWQVKGTEIGIRQGVDLWLNLSSSGIPLRLSAARGPSSSGIPLRPQLDIRYPRPDGMEFRYDDPWGHDSLIAWRHKPRFLDGDARPGQTSRGNALLTRLPEEDEYRRDSSVPCATDGRWLPAATVAWESPALSLDFQELSLPPIPGAIDYHTFCKYYLKLAYQTGEIPQYPFSQSRLREKNIWLYFEFTQPTEPDLIAWNSIVQQGKNLMREAVPATLRDVLWLWVNEQEDLFLAENPQFPRLVDEPQFDRNFFSYGDVPYDWSLGWDLV